MAYVQRGIFCLNLPDGRCEKLAQASEHLAVSLDLGDVLQKFLKQALVLVNADLGIILPNIKTQQEGLEHGVIILRKDADSERPIFHPGNFMLQNLETCHPLYIENPKSQSQVSQTEFDQLLLASLAGCHCFMKDRSKVFCSEVSILEAMR